MGIRIHAEEDTPVQVITSQLHYELSLIDFSDEPAPGYAYLTQEEVLAWRREFSAAVLFERFEGGHFFIFEQAADFCRRIKMRIGEAPRCNKQSSIRNMRASRYPFRPSTLSRRTAAESSLSE